MRYLLLFILISISGLTYGSDTTVFNNRRYIGFKPINLFIISPSIQYGIKLNKRDSVNREKFLDISIMYPYSKIYYQDNTYPINSNSSFGLAGAQLELQYRIVSKSKNNVFWAPVAEYTYIEDRYSGTYSSGYHPDHNNYQLFRLGIIKGKFRMNKAFNVLKAFYWGIAFRYVIDHDKTPKDYTIGNWKGNYFGFKIYLNYQFCFITSK